MKFQQIIIYILFVILIPLSIQSCSQYEFQEPTPFWDTGRFDHPLIGRWETADGAMVFFVDHPLYHDETDADGFLNYDRSGGRDIKILNSSTFLILDPPSAPWTVRYFINGDELILILDDDIPFYSLIGEVVLTRSD